MKKQAKGWLGSASDDLLVIEEIINNDYLTHMVAFHSQQAIEKAFKAILEEQESLVPKTHDLIPLHRQIKQYIDVDIDIDLLQQINSLYIDARYPSDLGLLPDGRPSTEISEKMYLLAKAIVERVKQKWA